MHAIRGPPIERGGLLKPPKTPKNLYGTGMYCKDTVQIIKVNDDSSHKEIKDESTVPILALLLGRF